MTGRGLSAENTQPAQVHRGPRVFADTRRPAIIPMRFATVAQPRRPTAGGPAAPSLQGESRPTRVFARPPTLLPHAPKSSRSEIAPLRASPLPPLLAYPAGSFFDLLRIAGTSTTIGVCPSRSPLAESPQMGRFGTAARAAWRALRGDLVGGGSARRGDRHGQRAQAREQRHPYWRLLENRPVPHPRMPSPAMSPVAG